MDPRETTYEDVERLLDRLTWDVCPSPDQWEDYRSVENVAYCEAYNNFQPGKCQFSTWVYIWVKGKLRHYRTSEQTKARRFVPTDPVDLRDAPDRTHRLADLLHSVSEDARVVIQVLLETPGDLARMTRRPKRTKRELWGRLRGMGWTMGRVVESMDEIKETLK